jgi:hypothetical protein
MKIIIISLFFLAHSYANEVNMISGSFSLEAPSKQTTLSTIVQEDFLSASSFDPLTLNEKIRYPASTQDENESEISINNISGTFQ